MMNKQESSGFPGDSCCLRGLANGVRLAWLIDPYEEKVWIYRAGQDAPEVVEGFAGKRLSDAAVLPGFELPLDTMRREH